MDGNCALHFVQCIIRRLRRAVLQAKRQGENVRKWMDGWWWVAALLLLLRQGYVVNRKKNLPTMCSLFYILVRFWFPVTTVDEPQLLDRVVRTHGGGRECPRGFSRCVGTACDVLCWLLLLCGVIKRSITPANRSKGVAEAKSAKCVYARVRACVYVCAEKNKAKKQGFRCKVMISYFILFILPLNKLFYLSGACSTRAIYQLFFYFCIERRPLKSCCACVCVCSVKHSNTCLDISNKG